MPSLSFKHLGNYNAIRGVSNTLMNLEAYELAEAYLREMLRLIPVDDSGKIGDTEAHLVRCLLRMGRLREAEGMIDKAIERIDRNTAGWSEMHIAVWKSHALMVKALIFFNVRSDKRRALELAEEALGLAEEQGLAVRVEEARELVGYLGAD